MRRVVREHRTWFYESLRLLLQVVKHPTAAEAARALFMLRDGSVIGGYLDDADSARRTFLATARSLCRVGH